MGLPRLTSTKRFLAQHINHKTWLTNKKRRKIIIVQLNCISIHFNYLFVDVLYKLAFQIKTLMILFNNLQIITFRYFCIKINTFFLYYNNNIKLPKFVRIFLLTQNFIVGRLNEVHDKLRSVSRNNPLSQFYDFNSIQLHCGFFR